VDQKGKGTSNIPLSKPVSFSVSWWSSELTQLVRNARMPRRLHKRLPCTEAWRFYVGAFNAKSEEIRRAKAANFKQAVAQAARGRRCILPQAKWAKERSNLP
jgi:hypothetical protein